MATVRRPKATRKSPWDGVRCPHCKDLLTETGVHLTEQATRVHDIVLDEDSATRSDDEYFDNDDGYTLECGRCCKKIDNQALLDAIVDKVVW
jgi:hypothetical protein